MRRIKSLTTILMVIVLMLGLLVIPAAAEETTPVGDANVEAETDIPVADVEENNTVIARVYEWTMENIDKVLTALMTGVVGGFALYQKGKNGLLLQGVGGMLKSQKGVESAAQSVTAGMDELKAQQAELNKYYEEYAKNEAERNKVTGVLLVEVMSMIELQHIAFINNGNVPQSLKNLATSKYARCLSVINDDAEIKAAYDEMRGVLGIAEAQSNEDKDT